MKQYVIKKNLLYFTTGGWSNFVGLWAWSASIDDAHLYKTKGGAQSTINRAIKWIKEWRQDSQGIDYTIAAIEITIIFFILAP